jgi:hypothetical protein
MVLIQAVCAKAAVIMMDQLRGGQTVESQARLRRQRPPGLMVVITASAANRSATTAESNSSCAVGDLSICSAACGDYYQGTR